jgi:2-pyrone-4,6-dicarboxylate lactonase
MKILVFHHGLARVKRTALMTESHNIKPAFRPAPGACDTHFHVFGPQDRYPIASVSRYQPPFAPLPEFLDLCRTLGIERMVFVQPSAYGTDNSCMFDAMDEVPFDKRRGIVDIDENLPEPEIEAMHARGVRGVRVNTSPVAKHDPNRPKELEPRIRTFAKRLASRGWSIEFLSPGWLTEALMPIMHELEIDFIIDHMGVFRAEQGIEQPGFQKLLKLAEKPNCWIKITGIYRISKAPGFRDAGAFAQALAKVAPDRMIWGSDYPHLSFADHVSSTELFNLLGEWFSDEADRRRILVDNPARLFGFGAT